MKALRLAVLIPSPVRAPIAAGVAAWEASRDLRRRFHEADNDNALPSPTQADYDDAAAIAGVAPVWLQTIAQIESLQTALSAAGQPIIRIEPHWWKKLAPEEAGAVDELKPLNPSDQARRWANFERLHALNPDAATRCSSFGCSQIMGFNHEICGFKNPGLFLQAMKRGARPQLIATARFISHPRNERLRKAMLAGDVHAVAHHYNGPKYRQNKYDEKLAAGLRRFGDAMA